MAEPRDVYVRDVFLHSILLEAKGHVGSFWSSDDRQRFSFCECSCGWANDTPSASRILDLWRDHVDELTPPSLREPVSAPGPHSGRHSAGGESK